MGVQGHTQIFEVEYCGGVHYARITRESLTPRHNFQKRERYYTHPSLTILMRASYGWDSFPVRFFLFNHLNIEYESDETRFFENTIIRNTSQSISRKFTQYSLYLGPAIVLPSWGNIWAQVNLGVGMSAIRMPSVFFSCEKCFEAQLFQYAAHGGMGLGGLMEVNVAYQFSEKVRLGMTYSYHGGRIFNSSVEYWLDGSGWISRREMPTPNILRWRNSLLSWSFVYTFQRTERKPRD